MRAAVSLAFGLEEPMLRFWELRLSPLALACSVWDLEV